LQTRGDIVRQTLEEEIRQEEIDRLIADQYRTYIPLGDQIIDVIPQMYTVDNFPNIPNPIGYSGVKVGANFHIITGDKNAIRNINRSVEKAGLKTKDLVLQPLASAAAVMSEQDLEAGVAIVDIGGGTTDLALFHEGVLRYTAVIPFGGNVITEDIRMGCRIMQKQAERLKVRFGSALVSESKDHEVVCIPGLKGRDAKEIRLSTLAGIIQARMEEIIELVRVEIRNSGFEKKIIGGIVVTGGGSQLKHLPQLFEYITGLDTRIGYPTEHLANTNQIENISSPIYATGIGLVLKGFEQEERGDASDVASSVSEIRTHADPRKKGAFFAKVLSKENLKKLENFFMKDED
jgi:cell division protein FtsA